MQFICGSNCVKKDQTFIFGLNTNNSRYRSELRTYATGDEVTKQVLEPTPKTYSMDLNASPHEGTSHNLYLVMHFHHSCW
jgi:hypothetical protein